MEFYITCRVGTEFWLGIFFLGVSQPIFASNEAKMVFFKFFEFFCYLFGIFYYALGRNETKWNDNLYFCLFLGHFQPIFALKEAITIFFEFFEFFLQFFMNFLLRVRLEPNGMIIFVLPVSRSVPTYYGFKWGHNGISKFSEFFFYFFGIFYYALGRNETER